MPKLTMVPPALKPYLWHGLPLLYYPDEPQARGECPQCGRSDKFSVRVETGAYNCFHGGCGFHGGHTPFLRWLWQQSLEREHRDKPGAARDLSRLAADRRLLSVSTLITWGVVRSALTNEWLVPGYGTKGDLMQLYRYTRPGGPNSTSKATLLATPGLHHGLFGADPGRLLKDSNPSGKSEESSKQIDTIFVCEGPWDGMALHEVLSRHPDWKDRAAVLAVPGATTFNPGWYVYFAGRKVYLCYDSDHPRTLPGGKPGVPAGYAGARRATAILSRAEQPPAEIHYLRWGPDGYDPDRPSGYDVRDLLSGKGID